MLLIICSSAIEITTLTNFDFQSFRQRFHRNWQALPNGCLGLNFQIEYLRVNANFRSIFLTVRLVQKGLVHLALRTCWRDSRLGKTPTAYDHIEQSNASAHCRLPSSDVCHVENLAKWKFAKWKFLPTGPQRQVD